MKNSLAIYIYLLTLHLLALDLIKGQESEPEHVFSIPLGIDNLFGGPGLTGVCIADINNDGNLEIIQNAGNKLFVYDYEGQIVNGWPQNTVYTLQQNAAVGDITGNGYKDIVALDRSNNGNSYLYAWDYQGSALPGFPLSINFNSGSMPETPILIDLNMDGANEIVFHTDSSIYVLDGLANNYNGWPKLLEERVYNIGVGDFNGDENVDITYTTINAIHYYNEDGSQLFEPFQMNGDSIGFLSISVADIDLDNNSEIFAGIYVLGNGPWETGMVLIDPETGIINGWPQWLSYNQFVFDPCSWADFNGDDTLEIIFGDNDGLLHVMDIHGSLLDGFPAQPGNSITAGINPPVGDIDGDGDMEIFIDNNIGYSGGSSRSHVFHHNGEEVSWSPLSLSGYSSFLSPALGDLDNNGSVEIIYAVRDYLASNQVGLHVFTIPGVPFETETFPWPMNGHDPQNTGWYDFPYYLNINEDGNELLPQSIELQQNFPNPFNGSTVIPYELSINSQVRISVINILGEEIIVLVNDKKPPGKYNVVWSSGKIPSGVYFAVLQNGNNVQTQKLILLK